MGKMSSAIFRQAIFYEFKVKDIIKIWPKELKNTDENYGCERHSKEEASWWDYFI